MRLSEELPNPLIMSDFGIFFSSFFKVAYRFGQLQVFLRFISIIELHIWACYWCWHPRTAYVWWSASRKNPYIFVVLFLLYFLDHL